MIKLPGIKVLAQIYESANSLVYRGIREQDNQPLILKVLKEDYPTPAELVRYQQEYEITRSFELGGVVKAHELRRHNNTLVMLLEDFGGQSLERLLEKRQFTLLEFLQNAIQIAETLGRIHQSNIIHKDINLSNIVLNPQTGELKIIDFGLSTVLSRENTALKSPNVLEGTLAYISPEQTGRMNRAIDYRTDFYSLGVTFYKILTNQLPFDAIDAMELVHCHIAKQPIPPHIINPEIPLVVSELVMKLLAKTAEERYQNALGIRDDLVICLRQLETDGKIEDFVLGEQDISNKFQIPQKLYGRSTQIETLLAAFERITHGTSQLMLVAGYSGIGKSVLVQEIYKPITERRGYYISGKFDQFQRNIPYSAIVSAFRELVRQLLTETSEQLHLWRDKLVSALGVNGQIIIDVIPEIELIIGKQPAVLELAASESQNRFNLVFQNFIHVFCQQQHPLVIFLDDLQWADIATLKLMQLMMTDVDTSYLLLIGAYRDNEVSAAHPLKITLSDIQKSGATVNSILLSPLDLTCINQLIADTLKCDAERAKPLAELVLAKTQGNPFFLKEFLQSLYTENLLDFDFISSSWQWNLDQIQARGITDNVVELMTQKIQKLPELTQEVLKTAACIGNQFDLKTVSSVGEKPQKETASELWSAVREGLIVPVGDDYKFLQTDRNGDEFKVAYRFVHDRIQQAAYSLIPSHRKQAYHLQIGQLLLNSTPPRQQEEKIFDIVNQLNFGSNLLENQQKRDELAKLNLIAGKKAKASAAYQPALTYLTVGLDLLNPSESSLSKGSQCVAGVSPVVATGVGSEGGSSWQTQYDTTLALYVEAAEAAYLCGQFDEMERLVPVVLQQGKALLDKVKVYEVKISAYLTQNKPLQAVDTGLTVLKLLGVSLPNKPSNLDILLGLIGTKLALLGKRIEDLIELPEMTAPDKLAAIRILAIVSSASYIAAPNLLPLVIFKGINISVKYGNASFSAVMYAAYGLILCGVLGDIESGYKFGNLALSLLERLNARKVKAKTVAIVNYFIRHWKEHGRQTLQPLLLAYSSGLETGDLEYGTYSILWNSYNSYCMGQELAVVEREAAKYSDTIQKLKQERNFHYINLNRQMVLNLMGQSKNPCRLIGDVYDESKRLPLDLEANDQTLLFHTYLEKLTLCYLFGEYEEALDNAALAEKYIDSAAGMLTTTLFYFYDSLARVAVSSSPSKFQQKRLSRKVQSNQKKLKKWAHHAPMNHLHKFYLVEAERHRVQGSEVVAMDYYKKAIALAKEHEYINEEALAHELAAKFYLALDQDKIAQVYMQDARYCYLRWGATAKVNDLDTRYPHLLQRKPSNRGTLSTKLSTPPTTTGSSTSSELDLIAIMKASQTLSEEILLDKLLAKLMRIIIENAGAQTGFLILEKKGKLLIEAEGAADKHGVTVLQSIPVQSIWEPEDKVLMSHTIVNYVARTQESVVLNDAANDPKFAHSPYIKVHKPKSILCFPLQHQGKLAGIIYLENNLTTEAFTPDRVELLNLLSSQAAISIDNARLYNNLTELNHAFERFVPRQFLQILDKESIIDVKLGDQVQQEMSVLFSDIREFTTLSESMNPQDNFTFINSYLSHMEPAIIENQGFIDKYIGDAIMALFSGEADNAVKAGIDMLRRLTEYNQHRTASGHVPIKIGIGINTGSLILGTVGGKNRMDSTVISDAVNLASRIESLTKKYGISLLISHKTFQSLPDSNQYAIRLIDRVKVKGKSKAVSIFEVFDADPPETYEGKVATRTLFEEALILYHWQKLRDAEQLFAECLRRNPTDKAAQIYQQRCTQPD
ncbi:AAA family ATPase [Coleofasciculus sp. FACHB-SPT9]|uniref:AAA family ATPase n=1 Tax=Cyanophyceae TaxID=3028117 RepID=UPI001683C66E|nr:AAA family ATPase [Coleofasciculus sp. FACHB-SPT9]MBD1889172.1 AAA family ATPase [Coleofasciculus sp. FACHB-SPT9]